ncbi:MAG: alanine--tRNA ligase [Anaerolineae bacterium]
MTSTEIRQAFLDFFASKGHAVVPSSSLIPDDPTLLFTNAGMVQFKDLFLGLEKRSYTRATTAQKCMRVSGKHNDLENVGPSPRHHTFFEMLGNFSFGDYFKREAIHYAWELITQVYGLPADRLTFTVFEDDDEAFDVWHDEIDVPAERIHRMGEKTNFWMMADTGPCGPTSEIHWDWGPERCTCGRPDCSVALDNDCGRWLELWNLVFMQFDQAADGTRTPLPRPGVDTGLGLERIVSVMQGVYSNYETDLFVPLMDRVQELLGDTDAQRAEKIVGYRVIADHSRAMTFLIADGVLPGNEGRAYVLRMIMRRAMRFGKKLGFSGPFLGQIAQVVIETMGQHYHELVERREFVLQAIAQEEERFQRTLDVGLGLLEQVIAGVEARGETVIPGIEVFRLYDTYGFPPDLTRDVAEEHGLAIDQAGFEAAMAQQRERARRAAPFGWDEAEEFYRKLNLPATRFLGYETLTAEGRILSLVRDGVRVEEAGEGAQVEVVLDQTPFYAEAGGQVGDTGRLVAQGGELIEVTDTRSPLPGLHVHYGRVGAGVVRVGMTVRAEVDEERRWDIMRNHTATHLLHKALREVLGEHARQAGSLVAPDHLRFDFTHLAALTPEELTKIEARVNAKIRENLPVTATHTSYEEAIRAGAVALFGEKYGDVVRMVSIDEYTRELCGGTHLQATGQIGFFRLVSEASVGAGLRRIEALTGRGAEEDVRQRLALLERTAAQLQAAPTEVEEKVAALLEEFQQQRKEIARLRRELARRQVEALLGDALSPSRGQVEEVQGVKVLAAQVEAADMDGLREMSDWLQDRLGSAVIVLGAVMKGRPGFVAAITPDLVERGLHAGKLVDQVARVTGGGGGGRPTMAQAGGKEADKIGEALELVKKLVRG